MIINKKHNFKAILTILLVILVLSFVSLYKIKPINAGLFTADTQNLGSGFGSDAGDGYTADSLASDGFTLSVNDKGETIATKKSDINRSIEAAKTWALTNLYEKTLKEGAAFAFWSAARQALNTIAYDTATWLGSGGNGRKPLFVTESWDTYLNNIADNAAGKFIEELGRNGAVKFNLCEPSFGVNVRVGLGLANVHRPSRPECSFSKLRDNWNTAIYEEDFLAKFQDMFSPQSNDIGYALLIHTGFMDSVQNQKSFEKDKLFANGGWLDIRDIAGNQTGIPIRNEVDRRLQLETDMRAGLGTTVTGTFADATNVFLNQLAVTALNNLMGRIGKAPISSPYSGNYGGWLSDYNASPRRASSEDLKDQFRKLVEPNFTERGDYEILGELSSCPNSGAIAGSSNCVIEEKFRQAITKRMTVGQALADGYLNAKGVFGFSGDNKEPEYKNQNYPYRSMIILRKYRIIPVGWEVAAQYLSWQYKSSFKATESPGVCTLGDMIACYSNDSKHTLLYDKYKSGDCKLDLNNDSKSDWCVGLVDPDWVLKSPKNWCKKQGYGPEFAAIEHSKDGYSVSRKDNYCADNQSCIKESSDGSCEKYGYCTEERGSWNFGGKTCDPIYNTCQTYRSRDGQTVSYLENTLEFCDENGVGCKEYCTSYDKANNKWTCADASPNPPAESIYLNDQAKECDAKNEGCHEFVRTKAGLGVNLLKNPSFEDVNGNTLKYWGSGLTVETGDSFDGKQSIKVGNGVFDKNVEVGPSDYSAAGNIYNFSFWAKNCSGTYSVGEDKLFMDKIKQASLTSVDAWQRYEVYYIFPDSGQVNQVNININSNNSSCLVDAVKLEIVPEPSRVATSYSDYKTGGVVYEKLMPDYLSDVCAGSSVPSVYNGNAPTATDYATILMAWGYNNSRYTITTASTYYLYNAAKGGWYAKGSLTEHPEWKLPAGVNSPLANINDVAASWGGWKGDNQRVTVIDKSGNYYIYNNSLGNWHETGKIKDKWWHEWGVPEAPHDYIDIKASWGGWDAVTGQLTLTIIDSKNYYLYDSTKGQPWYAKGELKNIWSGKANAPQDFGDIKAAWGSWTNGNQVVTVIDSKKFYMYDQSKPQADGSSWYRSGKLEDLWPTTNTNAVDSSLAECDGYVRKCSVDEVGCELYTSQTNTSLSLPAKVKASDYCPAGCVGYNTYMQGKTYFEQLKEKYLIPKTAKSCNANSAGCSEFTNLDKKDQGGEDKEYYSYLRRCQKPNPNECSEYYAWEGSDETGFQLKVFSLKSDLSDLDGDRITAEPEVYGTEFNNQTCEDINDYNPSTNPTCRQFYDKAGNVSYAFYQYTISCADDCHPFRLNNFDVPYDTDPNNFIDERKKDCDNTGGEWSGDINPNDTTNSCIYMAIPSEGVTCSASTVGCRKYAGNAGSNLMIVEQVYDFESGTQNWQNGTITSESSVRDGHSLGVTTNPITQIVEEKVKQGRSYELSFIAKNKSGASINLTAEISNGANSSVFVENITMKSDNQWNYYVLNLPMLDHAPTANEFLKISQGQYYIDNIMLTEKTVNYYFIKNSWKTPDYCDEDLEGNPSPGEMLGCDKYKDRANKVHYLKSFSDTCPESAVGCELVIDTHNLSSSYDGMTWNDANNYGCADDGKDCVEVSADSYDYVVYDKEKICTKASKGCQFLGQGYKYAGQAVYSSVYRLNNPDEYNNILCTKDDEGCESWSTSEGSRYFKDPGNTACEWRQGISNNISNSTWFKVKVSRCDTNNDGQIKINNALDGPDPLESQLCLDDSNCGQNVGFQSISCTNDFECIAAGTGYSLCLDKQCGCKTDADCGANKKCSNKQCVNSCVVDNNDYKCAVETNKVQPKTIGYGGFGNNIQQPAYDLAGWRWAGLCPAVQSGCTEYIDPASNASANLVKNSDFKQAVNGVYVDWVNSTQIISVEPFTLYSLTTNNISANISVKLSMISSRLQADNRWVEIPANANWTNAAEKNMVFFTGEFSGAGNATIVLSSIPTNTGANIAIKKTMIGYQLKKDVDKTSCNGIYRFGEGCIIFNERAVEGTDAVASTTYSSLIYDVFSTADGQNPQSGYPNNANTQPIKVEQDRVCNKWLACKTLVKDQKGKDVCYDVGLCDSLSSSNECNNWVINKQENQYFYQQKSPIIVPTTEIKNLSGYSKVAYSNYNSDPVFSLPNSLYNASSMKQQFNSLNLANGGFEYAGSNKYPIGWIFDGGEGVIRVKTGSSYVWSPGSGSSAGQLVSEDNYRSGWDETIFKVITNPTEAASEGICWKKKKEDTCGLYNPEGENFLSLNAQFNATSEKISVTSGDYILTGYVNTKKLTSGQAVISAVNGDATTSPTTLRYRDIDYMPPLSAGSFNNQTLIGAGQDWKRFVKKIQVPTGISKIKIHLFGADSGANTNIGKIFFDDLKIEPVLQVLTDDKSTPVVTDDTFYYLPKTCRLYPKDDSLTCTYYDDKGVKNIGMNGYCLEYDRYPGDPNACLLWYPIDKLKGEGIEEGAGYSGKFPVYYCGEVDMNFKIVESRRSALINYEVKRVKFWSGWWKLLLGPKGIAWFLINLGLEIKNLGSFDPTDVANFGFLTNIDTSSTGNKIGDGQIGVVNDEEKGEYKNCFGSGCGVCPLGYVYSYKVKKSWNSVKIREYCSPTSDDYVTTTYEDGQVYDWYEYNGDLQRVGGDNYYACYEPNTDSDPLTTCGNDDYKNYGEFILNIKHPNDSRANQVSDETGELIGLKNPVRVFFKDTRDLMPINQAINENKLMSCNKVYNTVTNIGENKAWYARIDTKSDYKININTPDIFKNLKNTVDLNYNSSYIPYGSIKNNVYPLNNPYDWDGNVNTPQKEPIVVGTGESGGTSFSCTGDNCKRLGICSGSGNNCLVYSIYGTYAIKNSLITRLGNESNFSPYAIINLPEQYSCPAGQICIPITPKTNEKDNLKRLFAENYGAWQWDKNLGTCEGGAFHGYACNSDNDCESNKCLQFCVNQNLTTKTHAYGSPCKYLPDSDTKMVWDDYNENGVEDPKEKINPDCIGGREGVCDLSNPLFPLGICIGGYFNQVPVCKSDLDCRDCNNNEGTPPITTNGPGKGNKCVGYCLKVVLPKSCTVATEAVDCPGSTCDPVKLLCSAKTCTVDTDCNVGEECVSNKCSSSQSCPSNSACPSGQCAGGKCLDACMTNADCKVAGDTCTLGTIDNKLGKCEGFDCISGLSCYNSSECHPMLHNGAPATESNECAGLTQCRNIPDDWNLICNNPDDQEKGLGTNNLFGTYCYVDCNAADENGPNGWRTMKSCPDGTTCKTNIDTTDAQTKAQGYCVDSKNKAVAVPCQQWCAGVDLNSKTPLGEHKTKCSNKPDNKKFEWCESGGVCKISYSNQAGYKTIPTTSVNDYWSAPTDKCTNTNLDEERKDLVDADGNSVPFTTANDKIDFCGKSPAINEIKSDKLALSKQGFINLTFHTNVDMYQLPLVQYTVDWGDTDTTVVSGVEMMDRPYSAKPEANNPHSLYHSYSYWNLKSKPSVPGVKECFTGSPDYCRVTPRIKIKDNWGWVNADAGGWAIGPTITVRER